MIDENRVKCIKAEQMKEVVTINKCDLNEFMRVAEDMCWILENINAIQYLREDLKKAITPILEKYEKIHPKTYKW